MRDPRPSRIAMIAGADRGIGAAIASRLAADRWQLTQPGDIGRIVAFGLDLPNTASLAETLIN